MIDVELPESAPPTTAQPEAVSGRRLLRWLTLLQRNRVRRAGGVAGVTRAPLAGVQTCGARGWTRIGDAASFELGVPAKIDFSDTVKDGWLVSGVMRSIWLYTADGKHFIAYNARCTHLGCGYSYDAEAKTFRCPCLKGGSMCRRAIVSQGLRRVHWIV